MTDHPLKDEELYEFLTGIGWSFYFKDPDSDTFTPVAYVDSPVFWQDLADLKALVATAREQTLAEIREQIKECVPEKDSRKNAIEGPDKSIQIGFNAAIDLITTNLKAKGLLPGKDGNDC